MDSAVIAVKLRTEYRSLLTKCLRAISLHHLQIHLIYIERIDRVSFLAISILICCRLTFLLFFPHDTGEADEPSINWISTCKNVTLLSEIPVIFFINAICIAIVVAVQVRGLVDEHLAQILTKMELRESQCRHGRG